MGGRINVIRSILDGTINNILSWVMGKTDNEESLLSANHALFFR